MPRAIFWTANGNAAHFTAPAFIACTPVASAFSVATAALTLNDIELGYALDDLETTSKTRNTGFAGWGTLTAESHRRPATCYVTQNTRKLHGVADCARSHSTVVPSVPLKALANTIVTRAMSIALGWTNCCAAVRISPAVLAETFSTVAQAMSSTIVAIFTRADFTAVSSVEVITLTGRCCHIASSVTRASEFALGQPTPTAAKLVLTDTFASIDVADTMAGTLVGALLV